MALTPLQQRYVDECTLRTTLLSATGASDMPAPEAAEAPAPEPKSAVVFTEPTAAAGAHPERTVRPTPGVMQLLSEVEGQAASGTAAELDLRRHYVGDQGAVCLLRALQFAGPGAAPEGDVLDSSASTSPPVAGVVTVDLRCSGLRNDAVDALASFLLSPAGASVTCVVLDGNDFVATAAGKRLVEALPDAPSVRTLSLEGTNVPPWYRRRIEAILDGRRQQSPPIAA